MPTQRSLCIATAAIHDHGALQKPGELAVLLDLVGPTSTVVEVGCDRGGTLWAFKQTGARVLGVTTPPGVGWFGSGAPLDRHGCDVILSDSHNPAVLGWLSAVLAGAQPDLVFIDADHRYGAVLADFNTYAPLVRRGGRVALHDICHHDPVPVGGGGFVEVGTERLWAEIAGWFPVTEQVVCEPTTWGGVGLVTL